MAAGAFVSATVDLGDVERGLTGMQRKAERLRSAWISLRRPMRADQRDHARRQEGPEGKWPKRSATTDRRAAEMRSRAKRNVKAAKFTSKKPRRHFRARRLLGSLPNRTVKVYALGAHGVVAESKVPWSGVHQDGGRVGRGSRIPARPFLWLSDRFLTQVEETLADHVAEGF